MGKFVLRKSVYGLIILFGVVTAVFFLQNSTGGNPALLLGGQNATEETIANIERDLGLDLPVYQRYLLYLNDISPISLYNNDPASRIFMDTAKYDGAGFVDFGSTTLYCKVPYLGKSYQSNEYVGTLIKERLDDTVVLAIAAILIAFVLGVIFGILSALRKGTFLDNSTFIIAVAGMSAPSFLTGAIFSHVFGYVWSEHTGIPLLPAVVMVFSIVIGVIYLIKQNRKKTVGDRLKVSVSLVITWCYKGLIIGIGIWLLYVLAYSIFGFESLSFLGAAIEGPGTHLNVTGQLYGVNDYTGEEFLTLENLILPAITLGIRPLALVTQLMRSSMLDVMNEDYIRTARAKGLSEWKVVVKHGLKNAMNPVVTALSGAFASMLAGAVFVEVIFSWNGIGEMLIDSIKNSDLPVILGVTIVISTFFVIINILVDIVYGILDPRIRLK
ncbi:MAG: ABC transporter permease [Flavobacteriales bacterium]|nr:ABC transporter permease [Flavobacteriales bacterium]